MILPRAALHARPFALASRMSPTSRVAMVAQHLSTSSSASASAPSPLAGGPDAPAPVVIFEALHSLRKMTLNRPQALNALNFEMVKLIRPQLEKWEASPLANVILFKGAGRNFCAGGDVLALTKELGEDPSTWSRSSEFFHEEYATDAFVAKMNTPVVTIMQGNTLGGGVGLSAHAPFRIATESTKIAMPETNLGLFTDVGATFFLSRLDGQLGLYLALTGARLTGAEAFLAGLASHYVPAERLEALEARLAELDQAATKDDVNAAIEEFSADAAELKVALEKYTLVGPIRRAIDVIFQRKTAEEIVEDLKALADGSLSLNKISRTGEEEKHAALKAWAKEAARVIEKASPTSVKLTLLAVRQGEVLTIDEAFQADMRIATACCNPVLHPDFKAGAKHILLDKKDKAERAPWFPSTLEEVNISEVKKLFFSSPPPFDHPPVPPFPVSQRAYSVYPHARFSLPSEKAIRSVVRGEDPASGSGAPSLANVVEILQRKWGGKIGVKEKVEEVVARQCKVDDGKWLTWPSGRDAI